LAETITRRKEILRAGHRLSQRSLANNDINSVYSGFMDKKCATGDDPAAKWSKKDALSLQP
jgi:hypothetical protein